MQLHLNQHVTVEKKRIARDYLISTELVFIQLDQA
jgi:hypothetical protein